VNNSNTALTLGGRREALEARLAHRLAARLGERAEQVSPDVSERLRFAREQALLRAREARAAAPSSVALGGGRVAVLGGLSTWWVRLGSALPILALAAGLVLIQHWHTQSQITTAAEIDADLLADDLPPDAYADAGFLEFLKTPRE
jgi:Protein of unknown function (DUF3619)